MQYLNYEMSWPSHKTTHCLAFNRILVILYVLKISVDCNADKVTIDDISVAAGGTVTVEFSADPNARFRCRLNNRRYRQCECTK